MRRSFAIALLLVGCGQDPTVVTPATFERPGAIDFVCVDSETSTLVVRELCEGVTGSTDDRYALVGLVTQTASGEVGAIDFRTRRVIDADARVPGFTFTRVGEFPSAIAVAPNEPGVTYVAAFGSRTVEWYPTGIFLGEGVPRADVQGRLALSGGPTDLVLAPEAGVAFVAVPSMGAVIPIPILADRSLGDASGEIVPTVPADLPAPEAGSATDYQFTCAAEGDTVELGDPDMSAVRTEVRAAGNGAEPHRLLVVDNVEPALDELLIADRQLPLIYRFTIEADGSLTELDPLAPGVPIRDLAVSPFVPPDIPEVSTSGSARYLYAIDDTDQSVLVMDFDPASDEFGSVLPVSFGQEHSDRLRLAGKATALDVIARDYDPEDPEYCDRPDGDEGPLNLRGVFLAVGLANGSMQIIDVVDLDGPCRGNQCTPDGAQADQSDQYVYIQRHRPRVANFVPAGVDTLGSPILLVDGVGRVGDSATGDEVIDGLVPVVAAVDDMGLPIVGCPAGQTFVFGELICATADPWALRAERWTATYEDTIPGTTELARFDGVETFTLEGGRDTLCDRGVLGRFNVAGIGEDEPEFGYVGDTLVVTTEPTEELRDDDTCRTYFEPGASDTYEREFVEIPVRRAHADFLEVEPRLASEGDRLALQNCYDTAEFVGIRLRLEQAFLVSGSSTGFLHRVIAGEPDGFCQIDTAGQPIDPADPSTYLNGRALNGTVVDPDADPPVVEPAPYQNPYIAFTLDAIQVNDEARLEINLTGTPTPFAIPVGARPGRAPVITIVQEVVYSPVDERLYVLDSNASSLVQYQVAEFQVGNVFE